MYFKQYLGKSSVKCVIHVKMWYFLTIHIMGNVYLNNGTDNLLVNKTLYCKFSRKT
jgi:hypothetical protein